MRSLKKLFQSRDLAVDVLEDISDTVGADVEAWRQSEGVKKDDGVVGGLLLLDIEGRAGDSWRALDETCRFGASVGGTRSPGAKVEEEAREPKSSNRVEARIVSGEGCSGSW